jgi:transposase
MEPPDFQRLGSTPGLKAGGAWVGGSDEDKVIPWRRRGAAGGPMYRELTMMEVREVLRRFGAGRSQRRIGRETGIGRNTVGRYVDAAAAVGFTEGEPSDSVVAAVAQAVQERPAAAPSEQRLALAPHRDRIVRWLKDERLKLTKIHVLLARDGVDASYATLRRFAIDELGWGMRAPSIRVDDPAPGDEAQIDFGCMGTMLDTTGESRKLWALIVCLSHSRYSFVYPTFAQDLASLCKGLDAARKFFGGAPRRIVPDNMKTIVVRAHATSPRLNDAFTEYAQSRGIYVDLARVRSPQDKARVENHVAYVRESCFEGERFTDLNDARRSAALWSSEVAGARVHGTTRRVHREHYAEVERAQMHVVPVEPFDVPLWTEAKVHEDHHIQVQHALYSGPTRYIGSRVRVRSDRSLVCICRGSEMIKTHPRKQPGQRSTDHHDYPPGTSDYALRSVDRFLAKAATHGPDVKEFTDRFLDCALPWTRMRQAHQLERLCRKAFRPSGVRGMPASTQR